jgi:ribonucleotide monophosphatase NagD (HAD superfamily)
VAAVAAAAGVSPEIAGKPHPPMADLVFRHFGGGDFQSAWMIGDRFSTDGAFARLIGCRFARVRSSVSEDDQTIKPEFERDSLWDVLEEIARLGG